jgi:hypothetical protein
MESFDQFFDPKPKPSLWKASLEYGIYAGLVITTLSLINLIPGMSSSTWTVSILSWIAYSALLIFVLTHFKKNKNGGYLNYGQGVGLGALTGLNGGFIAGVIVFVLYSAKPELVEQIMTIALDNMNTQGMTEDQMSMAMKSMEFMLNPAMLGIMTLFGTVFNFTIIALIASAFIKKD